MVGGYIARKAREAHMEELSQQVLMQGQGEETEKPARAGIWG